MKNIHEKDKLFFDKLENDIAIYGIAHVYANIFQEGFETCKKQSKKFAIDFADYCVRNDWKDNRFCYGKTIEELYEQFILDK